MNIQNMAAIAAASSMLGELNLTVDEIREALDGIEEGLFDKFQSNINSSLRARGMDFEGNFDIKRHVTAFVVHSFGEEEYPNKAELLRASFPFDQSPEGGQFWFDVYNKLLVQDGVVAENPDLSMTLEVLEEILESIQPGLTKTVQERTTAVRLLSNTREEFEKTFNGIKEVSGSYHDAFMGMFSWRKQPEGLKYWEEIRDKIQEIEEKRKVAEDELKTRVN